MTDTSVITDEMRRMVGVESQPYTFEVEKGDIVRYAQFIGEHNPLFTDELHTTLLFSSQHSFALSAWLKDRYRAVLP